MKNVRADARAHLLWGLDEARKRATANGREKTQGWCYMTARAIHNIEVDEENRVLHCTTVSREGNKLIAETYLPWELLERMDSSK